MRGQEQKVGAGSSDENQKRVWNKGNPKADRALLLGGGKPRDGRYSAGQERVGSQTPRESDVRATKGKRENDILEERKIKERLRDTKP